MPLSSEQFTDIALEIAQVVAPEITSVEALVSLEPDLNMYVEKLSNSAVRIVPTEAILDLPLEELKGVLAHELAHVALGHLDDDDPFDAVFGILPAESRRKELDADSLAAKHGYGAGNIAALKRAAAYWAGEKDVWFDSTHPRPETRIANIKRIMKGAQQ